MSDYYLSSILSLQAAVGSLQAQVHSLHGEVAAQGTPIAAQGHAITSPVHATPGTITSEASARVSADDALATHIGGLNCNLQDNRAAAAATSFLTTRITSADEPTLQIDLGQAVEPLCMGNVVFHGETARQIRAAQTVLRQAGAGQLEVVKRESEGDSPFVVIDGQVFITEATIKDCAIDLARFKVETDKLRIDHVVLDGHRVNLAVNEQGQYYVAGVGLGMNPVTSGLRLGPSLEEDVRRLLREELKPGGILHRY